MTPAPVRARRWKGWVIATTVLVQLGLVVVIALAVATARGGSETYPIVIPEGTFDEISAGAPIEIIPAEFPLRAGDTVVVENHDDHTHLVGPFTVRAGETLRHTFRDRGVFSGVCSIHPGGTVSFVVT